MLTPTAPPSNEAPMITAAELVEEMRKLERELLRLQPTAALLSGYHAGYEAGVSDTKRRVAAALELE